MESDQLLVTLGAPALVKGVVEALGLNARVWGGENVLRGRVEAR